METLIFANPHIIYLALFALSMLFIVNLFQKVRQQARTIRKISSELDALLACSRGISERLHQHQKQFKIIQDRQDHMEVPDNGDLVYKHAISLINRGMTEDEMMDSCELSRGEISMIAHLQKARQHAKRM